MSNYLKFLNNLFLFSLIFICLFFFTFEIFFYEDRILPNLDTLHAVRSLENFLIFNKPFSEFYSGMSYKWDKYDLFNFLSVYFDSVIFKLLKLSVNLNIFLNFKILFKSLIIVFTFLLFYKIFKSLKYSLLSVILILSDGSFSHVLHNSHHYLILVNLIIFSIYYFKIFKNFYLNNFFIGALISLGSLTIIVSGIIWGFVFLSLIAFYRYKNRINNFQVFYFLLGSLVGVSFYLFSNIDEINNLLSEKNNLIFNENYLFYTIKYFILNIFNIFFGQHGNNFLFLFLILIFLNKKSLKNEFDKNVAVIFFVSIAIFFILGTIIDPLHYYPSRLGIFTPLAVYLLFKIYNNINKSNFIISNKLSSIIIIFLSLSISKKILDFRYEPDTTLVGILSLSLGVVIILLFLTIYKFINKKKINFIYIIFILALSLKFFPDYKINQISTFTSDTKEAYLKKNINIIISDYSGNCITTNYPEYNLFKNSKLLILSASNLHSNKKGFWGKNNCDLIVLILNSNKEELNQFIKVNFLKKNLKKIDFNKNSLIFYNNFTYKIKDLKKHNNVEIYSFKKTNNAEVNINNLIYFTYN